MIPLPDTQTAHIRSATDFPLTDPAPIFEIFRGNYGTELLVAAATHFNVFRRLSSAPLAFDDFRREFKLEERPAIVLLTALRAFGLVIKGEDDRFTLSALAREHLVPDSPFGVSDFCFRMSCTIGTFRSAERSCAAAPLLCRKGDVC